MFLLLVCAQVQSASLSCRLEAFLLFVQCLPVAALIVDTKQPFCPPLSSQEAHHTIVLSDVSCALPSNVKFMHSACAHLLNVGFSVAYCCFVVHLQAQNNGTHIDSLTDAMTDLSDVVLDVITFRVIRTFTVSKIR